MNENENLVPKRRFKEFTNSDAWEQRKLGEHSQILAGGTPKTQIKEYWEPKEIPWMSSGEINKKRLFSTDNQISKLGFENSSARWVKENSVLIALAGQGKTRGTVAINEIPLTTNQSIAAIEPDDKLDSEFLFQNLEKRYEELRLASSGDGSRGGLNKQIISDIKIIAPSVKEQSKIGLFFKHLDDTIALHQRKLEKSKALKSAYLSEMFPAEGERKPKRRFAGFTDDWEQRKLLDMSERICVGFVGTCEQYYTDSTGIPMYRTGNLNGLYLNKDDLKYVTQEFHNKNMKSQLKRGDILIARHGDSGKAVIYNYSDEANCLNIVIIRPNSNECDYRFLAQCINSPMPSKQIKGLSAGSTQSVINTKEIEKLVVSVPRNVEEQKVLANFFFNLDNVIALHQHKLEKLQNIKQAYLNELFV